MLISLFFPGLTSAVKISSHWLVPSCDLSVVASCVVVLTSLQPREGGAEDIFEKFMMGRIKTSGCLLFVLIAGVCSKSFVFNFKQDDSHGPGQEQGEHATKCGYEVSSDTQYQENTRKTLR